jgi:hypothetical protein
VPDPAHASLPCLVESRLPLLFAVAERDPDRFQAAAADVVAAWLARRGTVPNLVWIDGHNHMSAVGSLGVDEAALGVPLARFVDRHTVLDSEAPDSKLPDSGMPVQPGLAHDPPRRSLTSFRLL